MRCCAAAKQLPYVFQRREAAVFSWYRCRRTGLTMTSQCVQVHCVTEKMSQRWRTISIWCEDFRQMIFGRSNQHSFENNTPSKLSMWPHLRTLLIDRYEGSDYSYYYSAINYGIRFILFHLAYYICYYVWSSVECGWPWKRPVMYEIL